MNKNWHHAKVNVMLVNVVVVNVVEVKIVVVTYATTTTTVLRFRVVLHKWFQEQ